MHETYITDEVWGFDCRRCGNQWSITYEVQHALGFEDDEFRLWYRGELPAMSPEAGVPCPRCAGLRVEVSPPLMPRARQGTAADEHG